VAECGAYTAYPEGMNSEGTVVGAAQTIDSTYSLAFYYANGVCKVISLGTTGTSFLGITDNNEIFGLYGNLQNYLYAAGNFTGLPSYPGVKNTYYCCLNTATGMLAGNYLMETSLERYGFILRNGTFTPLPSGEYEAASIMGMNANGVVVGTMNGLNLYGFTYIDGKIKVFQYPGATYTTFNGISDSGIVVGTYYVRKTGKIGIFSYDLETGTWTDLNFPPDYVTVIPVGITNSGVIAALYSSSGGLVIATPTKSGN